MQYAELHPLSATQVCTDYTQSYAARTQMGNWVRGFQFRTASVLALFGCDHGYLQNKDVQTLDAVFPSNLCMQRLLLGQWMPT